MNEEIQLPSELEEHIAISIANLEHDLRVAEGSGGGRDSAIKALAAIINFINSIPQLEAQTLAMPFTRLMSALNDLENGQQVAMFKPTSFQNRPPESSMRNVIKAYSIFAVDCLRDAEPKARLEDACKFVADILQSGGENTDWKTVRNWRSDSTRNKVNQQLKDTLAALRAECRYPVKTPQNAIKGDMKVRLRDAIASAGKGLE